MKRREAYLQLMQTLLGAMGVAACGGKAVIDPPADEGSGASTSSSASGTTSGAGGGSVSVSVASSVTASSSSSSGTVPFTCDITTAPYESLLYQCITDAPGNPCPDPSSEVVVESMTALLEWSDCSDFCCTGEYLVDVPCGPDPSANACCYYGLVEYYDVCEGRPFSVDAELRTAPVEARSDWRAALQPTLAGLDEGLRRTLAEGWLTAALDEHASIAAFARFSMQLLAVGAPPELIRATQKATMDEVTHAELCFGLASAYAGEPLGPGTLAVDDAMSGVSEERAIAIAVVIEGCVGETISSMVAHAALERCEDPAVARVLKRIHADETRHAGLAWQYLAWALRKEPTLAFEVADAFRRALSRIDDELARSADEAVDLRRHGRLGRRQRLEVARDTLREVIVPCARALLVSEEEPSVDARPRA
jgi:hypothetical protein